MCRRYAARGARVAVLDQDGDSAVAVATEVDGGSILDRLPSDALLRATSSADTPT